MKKKGPGGLLGRNLRHLAKIKNFRRAIFAVLLLMVTVTAIEQGNSGNDNYSKAGFGVAGVIGLCLYRDKEGDGGTPKPKELTPEQKEFLTSIQTKVTALIDEKLALKMKEGNTELEGIQATLKKLNIDDGTPGLKELQEAIKTLQTEFKASKEQPARVENLTLRAALKQAIEKNREKITALKTSRKSQADALTIELKVQATQVPGDIGTRTDDAMFLPGINQQPVRDPFLRQIFRVVPTSREYIKYREQDTVTRDAKVVIACAGSTHTTKVTWVTTTEQIQKIRDMVDICLDMMDDYDFVEAEIRNLLDTSINLKEDSEFMFGTGDINSIDGYASEFNPANPLASFEGAAGLGFQAPTIAEVVAAMAAQIYIFGQEKKWVADTIIMNHADWVRFMHAKDENNNYLLPNFVLTGGRILEGMRVLTNPLIPANELYVFDSRQGFILDRQQTTLEFSYENNDNFEKEIVTAKVVKRVQFIVKGIDQDAFMKVSDIEAAKLAITNA